MIDSNLVDKVNIPELVEALRDGCDWTDVSDCIGYELLMHDAAAAIETIEGLLETYRFKVRCLEPKRGEWIEREVIQDRRDARIPEWQQARCSVCGKWHTTPYMYCFDDFDYCPNCGAKMEVQDGKD